ncbi:anthrax toxin receptor 2-like isoform X1 [Oculina patagonica]
MQMAFTGRYFVLVVLLQAWIIPKLVFSQQKCLGGFDIYFILDKSGSVLPRYFQGQTVDFVERTVENFVGKGVRFSFITFSSDSITETILKLTGDRTKIKEGLNKLRKVQPGGDTMLGKALIMANNQVKDQSKWQSAFSIYIILTDGKIDDIGLANEQSKRAKQAGTIVYVIGVALYDKAQLNILANKPPEDFVFTEPSYLTLRNLTSDISNRTCVEITSVKPKQACLGERNTVTMYGRGFEKFNSPESHSVRCGFRFNDTYHQVTKASLVEENRLVCPVPILNDTESVLMLQVSLNNGKTFVSSNVNISAKNCSSGAKNRTENGTKPGNETEKENEKPESEKRSQWGLAVALLFLFAFLILLAVWWFWPRFSRKPPRNYQPAVKSDPSEPPLPQAPSRPPPPVQKTASGRTKWPTVDASFYGGGTAGGIVPVRVHWGEKGSTEAGARLAKAKPSIINDTDDEPENSTSVSSSSSTPGCWTAAKIKVMAGVDAVSAGYRRVASHRPQRDGHWLYSSNPTV